MSKKTAVSSKTLTNPRMLWPDVIRIIAIYFVVQVHTTFNNINFNSADNLFNRLDTMGVPLFVLLSGALLLGKNEDYKTFFRKRCIKVLIPWVIWTFFYMIYLFIVHHNSVMSNFFANNKSLFYQWFHFFFRTFMSTLYFLPLIFGIYVLTPLLRIVVRHATNFDNFYILLLWFIILSVMPWLIGGPLFPTWEPTIIYAPIQFSGYFLLGYIVIKQHFLQKIRLPFLFLISVLPFILILIPTNLSYIQNFTEGYLFPGTVIAAVFLFYFLFAVFDTYDEKINPFLKKIITLISNASFGVYLLNEMFIDYFKNELIKISAVVHQEFLISITTYLIITIIILIIKKIPVIKYIVP